MKTFKCKKKNLSGNLYLNIFGYPVDIHCGTCIIQKRGNPVYNIVRVALMIQNYFQQSSFLKVRRHYCQCVMKKGQGIDSEARLCKTRQINKFTISVTSLLKRLIQRHIEKLVKHLRWSVLQKQIMTKSHQLF